MKSLRAGLTLWLWIALAIVAVISAASAMLLSEHEALEEVDYQMQQVVRILATQTFTPADELSSGREVRLSPAIRVSHDRDDELIVTVRNEAGELLFASRNNRHIPGGVLPPLKTLGFQTLPLGQDSYRVFAAQARGQTIQIAQSTEAIRETESRIALATLIPIAVLLPILAVVAGVAIRRELRPLNSAAAAIAGRPPLSLDPLQAEGIPAEVRPLVDEFNRLLLRVSTAIEREQRFVTDAAHALRTPLTAVQLQAEILDGGSTAEERASRLSELRGGIRRVIRLSEQLLSLARSQSEPAAPDSPSDLDTTLREIAAHYTQSAKAKGIDLTLETSTAPRVRADARRLTLIFGNLLDNALRFTPSGGRVEVRAHTAEGLAVVEVRDEGCGLPADELDRVFERFYRVTDDEGSGSGLGLATVRALVDQISGAVRLANRSDRAGLIVIVCLPLDT